MPKQDSKPGRSQVPRYRRFSKRRWSCQILLHRWFRIRTRACIGPRMRWHHLRASCLVNRSFHFRTRACSGSQMNTTYQLQRSCFDILHIRAIIDYCITLCELEMSNFCGRRSVRFPKSVYQVHNYTSRFSSSP